MSYKSSPRPDFSEATPIPYAKVTRHIWGDAETGLVDDWIYASTGKIHQLVFGVAPGQGFKHSQSYRTVFGADEVLYVLSGALGAANPETGEVRIVNKGEALFFRKDTWHHGFSLSPEPLRVLEYFAPPPSTGTSGAYARTKPYVSQSRYRQDRFIGKWPMASADERSQASMRHMTDSDLLWELDADDQGTFTGLYASSEHLTVGRTTLLAGRRSRLHAHGGDECLYVLSGIINVHVPEKEGQVWFELHPGDGFFVPEGTRHAYFNMGAEPASLMFGVAPSYDVKG